MLFFYLTFQMMKFIGLEKLEGSLAYLSPFPLEGASDSDSEGSRTLLSEFVFPIPQVQCQSLEDQGQRIK